VQGDNNFFITKRGAKVKKLSMLIGKNDFLVKLVESFFGKVAYLLFTMLFSLIFTRLYGAEVFGEYTYAISVVTILMIFAKVGFDNSIIYYIPKYGNAQISLSFAINFLLSLIITLVSFFFIDQPFVQWMLPMVWLLSMEQVFFGVYRGTNNIKKFYFINGFYSILLRIILIVILFFISDNKLLNVGIAVYSSYIFANLIYYLQNKKRFEKIKFDKEYIKYSFSLVLAAMMWVAIDKVDVIMIGSMLDMKSVGVYQISSQLSNLIFMVLVIFDTVFGPKISQLYHEGKLEELKQLYIRSTRILAVGGTLLVVIMLLLSKYILLLFGSEFVSGQLSLVLRGIGQLVNVSVGSVWLMLAMTGKPKFQIYTNLTAFLLNIGLNYLLIPQYGINGAAFASMVSVILINVIGYLLVSREFKIKVYKYV
jgi:O-antigen/teichoic acid export membrane protein